MKTWTLISLRKFRKLQHLLFWVSVTKQSFENGFGFPQWLEIPTLPAIVLKFNVTLARPLRLVILYFFKMENLDRRLYLHDSKWNSRSDVDWLTHTKQLLSLLCIVYLGVVISIGEKFVGNYKACPHTVNLNQSTESADGDGGIEVCKSSNREVVSSIALIQSEILLTRRID